MTSEDTPQQPSNTPSAATVETLTTPERRGDRRYLLVFNGPSSWMHEIPPRGEVSIGRSETSDLCIDHASVSRNHARLVVQDDAISLVDLGSQNGTCVNDVRITGEQALCSGDVITIHKVTLIVHTPSPTSAPASVLPPPAFRQKLDEELDRAVRYDRAFSVLCVLWKSIADRKRVERVVTTQLRRIDAMMWTSELVAHLLLAEATDVQAQNIAKRLRKKLEELGGEMRIGRASCSSDGFDADVLLAAAHEKAVRSGGDDAVPLAHAHRTMTIDGRKIVIADPAVVRLYALIERLAPVNLPILITGETGCGKELAAAAIHALSPRSQAKLISLNCAAIQETLVESELFGHERGAFSGAVATKPGLVEAASGSTLFLDEIGELALQTQAKLLRVLETGKVTRVGDVRERDVDVRVVAATNRDLEAEVTAGRFRQDLYFRLSGATLRIPPLRHRPHELPLLAVRFLEDACKRANRRPMTISEGAMAALAGYAWPGNVRELRNLMMYLAAAHDVDMLLEEHIVDQFRRSGGEPAPVRTEQAPNLAPPTTFRPLADEMRELEIARMRAALEATDGNQTRAAGLLSMPVRTFFEKVKQHGLQPRKKS